jgi:hypothetical protein
MGEFLRSSYAKRFIKKHSHSIRRQLRAAHQWGVGVPGACEAMGHWRTTVEPLIQDGLLQPMVAADLDLENMFGSVEWDSIRDSINEELREVKSWTEWHHEQPAVAVLPNGDEFATDRGAEQGDAFGPLQAGCVLARHRPQWARAENGSLAQGACDEWFIDDCQAFVAPLAFDPWLRAVDAALQKFGASRGTVAAGTAKSTCRLLCPPILRESFAGWDTEYVRSTVKVLEPDAATSALGAPIGGPGAVTANMSATLRNTDTARMTLLEVGHAPTEMVLTRLCGDVAKVTYSLRLNGDIVTDSQLGAHDQSLRRSLEAILGGEVTDAAWTQATVGVRQGGLGLREARGIALSAFLASRIASRPHVQELAQHMQDVGLAPVAVVMRAFDQRTDDALTQLVGELDSEIGTALVDQLTDLASTAQLQWDALFDESASQPSEASARRLRRPGAAAGLVPNDEDGDDEHPDAGTPTTAMHIQKVIYAAVDSRRSAELLQALREEGDVSSLRRLEA